MRKRSIHDHRYEMIPFGGRYDEIRGNCIFEYCLDERKERLFSGSDSRLCLPPLHICYTNVYQVIGNGSGVGVPPPFVVD